MAFGSAPFGAAPFGATGAPVPTGAPELQLELITVNPSAVPELQLELVTFSSGAPELQLELITVNPSAVPELQLELVTFSSGAPELQLELITLDFSGYGGQALKWRPVVRLGGADVSARLKGTVTVEIEESSARLAEFSLVPAPGVVAVTAWVGRPVEIDVARMAPDGSALSPVRIFTGVVDEPAHDVTAGTVRFACTDLLQEAIDRAERTAIDALIGGRWAEAVSGPAATNWDYAQAQLESVPAALDLDAWRGLRVTPWAAKPVADIELTADDLIDGEATQTFAERSQVVNRRTVRFQYRFPRLQSRAVVRGYKYPFDLGAIVADGYDIPTREMIRQALDGTGWEIQGEINYDPVPGVPSAVQFAEASNWTGKVTVPMFGIPVTTPDGKFALWSVAQDVAEQLCFGFTALLKKRWAQSVEEAYTLTVEAPASVAQLGAIADATSAALEDEFDTAAWEAGPPQASRENAMRAGVPAAVALPEVPDVGPGHSRLDGSGDTRADRAAATHAIETLVAQARVKILGSHRLHAVSAAMAIEPRLDLTHTVRVVTDPLVAKGKVRRVTHTLDMEAGSAVTAFELAVSRTEAVGVQTDSPVTAPAEPPAPVPADLSMTIGGAVISTWVGRSVETPSALPSNATGFFTNLANTGSSSYLAAAETYPVQFVVEAPAVPDEERDNRTVPIAQSYSVAIPEDELLTTFS